MLLALLFPLAARKLSSVAGSTALRWCETQGQVVGSTAGSFDDLSKFPHLCGLCFVTGWEGGKDRSQIRASEVILHSTTRSSSQLSKPEKVSIPERYVELDPEEPPSLEELQARYRKAEKIRNILARSRSALSCSTLEVSQTPSR